MKSNPDIDIAMVCLGLDFEVFVKMILTVVLA